MQKCAGSKNGMLGPCEIKLIQCCMSALRISKKPELVAQAELEDAT